MTQTDRTPNTPPTSDAAPVSTPTEDDGPARSAPVDPVTGTTGNATGEQQAAENEQTDPVA